MPEKIDYDAKIPNNVNLSEDRRLQRAHAGGDDGDDVVAATTHVPIFAHIGVRDNVRFLATDVIQVTGPALGDRVTLLSYRTVPRTQREEDVMQYLDTQLARQLVTDRQGRLRSEAVSERVARPARRRGEHLRRFDALRVARSVR